MAGPLAGIRVLDIGNFIAAPFGAGLMADFGAEVIKVEAPGEGDMMRHVGVEHKGVGIAWAVDGRNKKCVTLAIGKKEGRDLFLRLVEKSDVLMENFTPGTLERWDLGEEVLHAANPGLVLVRVSGYGQTGPYSRRPSVDRVTLAYAGVTYLGGFPDSPPVRPGVAVADYGTGLCNALSAMIALYHRDRRGGEGQTIDLALFEVAFRMTCDLIAIYDSTGEVRERTGNANPNTSPGDAFQMKDGRWVVLVAATDKSWRNLTKSMGQPELQEDPRFLTSRDRVKFQGVLHSIIGAWVATLEWDELRAKMDAAGVPASLILSAADIATDEHFLARQAHVAIPHPELGSIRMPNVVAHFSKTPGEIRHPGLPLGANNEDIFCGLLGLSGDELDALRGRGVV